MSVQGYVPPSASCPSSPYTNGSFEGSIKATLRDFSGSVPFSIFGGGGISLLSTRTSPATVVGYASIQPDAGNTSPSGLAIFSFHQNGVLVTEAGVPASPLLQSGRIYAEVNALINTGLAMANPNAQPATVSFFFSGPNGNFGDGSTTIPANGQIANFLNQSPFNGGSSLSGAFTFNSSVPISVIALRGLTNERGEFLITTLPVADLSAPSTTDSVVFPDFADGGGWTTEVVLVNPGDTVLTGTVQFLNQSGQAATVSVNGQSNSSFAYSILARSSQKLQTSSSAASVASTSVRCVASASRQHHGSIWTGDIFLSQWRDSCSGSRRTGCLHGDRFSTLR